MALSWMGSLFNSLTTSCVWLDPQVWSRRYGEPRELEDSYKIGRGFWLSRVLVPLHSHVVKGPLDRVPNLPSPGFTNVNTLVCVLCSAVPLSVCVNTGLAKKFLPICPC